MKYCPRCGAELEPGSKFCTKCGSKIDDAQNTNESASWIKAEQGSKDKNQDTMVFNQPGAEKQQKNQKNPNAGQNPNPEDQPESEEESEKNKRANSILTGVLIGLLVVAIAVGGFFIWKNRQDNKERNGRRSQQTTQSSEGNPNGGNGNYSPGELTVLTPSAQTDENASSARRKSYSGLINDHGRTSYVTGGRRDNGFTGIVKDDSGKRYFVVNGKVRYGYSGDVEDENGNDYSIVNGQVASGPDESGTTTTSEDDQGVDSTEYNETDNSNGAQKFDDYDLDNGSYINLNPPELKEGKLSYGVDSVTYDEDGNYVVTVVVLNGTNKDVTIKEIDNLELRDGGGDTLATGQIDDVEGMEINANDSATFSTTLVNESHGDTDLSNSSIVCNIVTE